MPSASASAKEPIVSVGPPSNRGVHAPPRSSVRQRPPEAKPTRSESGWLDGAATSTTRPPWTSGPTLRKRISERSDAFSISSRFSYPACLAAAPMPRRRGWNFWRSCSLVRSGFSSARRRGAEKTKALSTSGQTKQDLRKETSRMNRVCEQASNLFLASPGVNWRAMSSRAQRRICPRLLLYGALGRFALRMTVGLTRLLRQECLQVLLPHRRPGVRAVASRLRTGGYQDIPALLDVRHELLHQTQLRRIHHVVGEIDGEDRRDDVFQFRRRVVVPRGFEGVEEVVGIGTGAARSHLLRQKPVRLVPRGCGLLPLGGA